MSDLLAPDEACLETLDDAELDAAFGGFFGWFSGWGSTSNTPSYGWGEQAGVRFLDGNEPQGPIFPGAGNEYFINNPRNALPNDIRTLEAVRDNPELIQIPPGYDTRPSGFENSTMSGFDPPGFTQGGVGNTPAGQHYLNGIDNFLLDYRNGTDTLFPGGSPGESPDLPEMPTDALETGFG